MPRRKADPTPTPTPPPATSVPGPMNSRSEPTADDFASQLKAAVKDAQAEGRAITADAAAGRPRVKADTAPAIVFTGAELAPVFFTLGNMVCRRFAVTEVSHDESRELALAFAPLLTKYGGGALARFGPELAAATVLLKVAGPRVLQGIANNRPQESTPPILAPSIFPTAEKTPPTSPYPG